MHRSRLILLALTAVGVLVTTLAPSAGATAAVNYVALGDSYSAGVGAGNYLSSSGSCERSPNAYSALWAAAHAPASYVSVACSGATSATVTSSQLAALSPSTTLVSITVGGNDVGFTNTLETCILEGTSDCVAAVNAAETIARTTLPGTLNTLFGQIHSDAPNSRVVVLGYPRFYDTSTWFCIGLSNTSRTKINEGADVLDSTVQAAAAGHGFSFGDVRSQFANHEICDSSKWLHALNFTDFEESYHPTAAGQAGAYLPVFTAAAG
jgi:lysophospholipase L1-like esterase